MIRPALALLALAACAKDPAGADSGTLRDTDPTGTTPVPTADWPTTAGGDRPAAVTVPAGWDGVSPLPLIVLLHGYGVTGALQDAYFGLSARADSAGFVLVAPDGTTDSTGAQFWNATDACCNFDHSDVDDVAYLEGIVDELSAELPIDRVMYVGHSNGGFMAHRMACEDAGRIDAIASLAGATFLDESDCHATRAPDVLQIHGTADDTILFDGTAYYPGAEETVQRWADRSGCAAGPTPIATLDADGTVAGEETTQEAWTAGCDADVELWRIVGGGHIPLLTEAFRDALVGWVLSEHPAP